MSTNTDKSSIFGRVFIYGTLLIFAFYFLAPLYVLIVTSFKTLPEIRDSSILSLPGGFNLEAWKIAWSGDDSSGCTTGVACTGMAPYFINTILMAVPAVLISTFIGALNGYVLTKWNFRGAKAGALIAGIPTLLVYIVAGKYFVKGLTAGAVKG